MLIQKISILIFILSLSLLNPAYIDSIVRQPSENLNKYSSNIDLLNDEIKKSGWNNKLLNSYHFFLINAGDDLKNQIRNLPSGYGLSFLNALLLKKEKNHAAMFDTLQKSFSDKISYLPYFEELVSSASAAGKIKLVEDKINKQEFLFKDFIIGLLNNTKGEYNKAVNNFNGALINNPDEKNILYQLSYAYRNSGDYDNAGKTLKRIKELYPEDKWLITKTLIAEGSIFFLSGDYDIAVKFYEDGLNLAKANSDKQNEGKAYINLGIIEDISGNIEKAHDYFNKAISLTSSIKDYENLAVAYSELGVSYTFINDIIEAKNNYLKSLGLFEQMNNKNRLSLLHNNIGKIYMSLFNYESALSHYEKGLKFSGDDKRSMAMNLMGMADVYANISNYSKAIHYYREAQNISSEIKDVSLSAEINSGIGSLNFNLDRFNNAIQYYSEAKKYAEESGNPFVLTDVTHKLAISYHELDSINISEALFNRALELSKENAIPYYEALISIDLAVLQKENKDYKKALENILSAEKRIKEFDFDYLSAKAKITRGEIENELGNFNKAKELFVSALDISNQLNEYSLQIESNYFLAKLFDQHNLFEAAESYYNSAVRLIEDVSKPLFTENEVQISYFSTQKEVYDSFAGFYLNQKKFREAFELIDKSRSRNTLQNLSNLKLQVLLDDKEKLEKIYEYEWMINSGIYVDRIHKIKNEYAVLKERLISDNNELQNYLKKENHITIEDVQKNLNEKEYFISFHITNDESFIFLINNNDFVCLQVPSGRDELLNLKENISPYFNSNTRNESTFYNHDLFSFNAMAAYEFYKVLLEKALSEIPEDSRIIFSPPAELVTLPFDFLIASFKEGESSYNYDGKDYLIYHYNISYTPSGAVFVQQKNNSLTSGERILVAGNPEINNDNNLFADRRGLLDETGIPRNIMMFPLKYSGEEIAQVSDLINADKVLTAVSATETGFKENAELSKIIHLSTHSFLFNKQPIIFFSNNDEDNDGFLEAGEIVQMKLNSDLVVLSSCNSGLGYIDESEGIVGMTKAFFEAGTKSIVVSLWEVNDKYTSKFMSLFYKKLSEGFDKDEALRKAKIDFIRRDSPNPYFWSAFVISGNTDKIELKTNSGMPYFIAGFSAIILFMLIILVKRRSKVN